MNLTTDRSTGDPIADRTSWRRRSAPVWTVAAVVATAAGLYAVRSTLTPGAEHTTTTRAPAHTSAVPGIAVGGFTFTPPPGFVPTDRAARSNRARFGPEGLLNDGEPLRAQDMQVSLRSWALTSPTGGRLWVTQIVPEPTAQQPGPRPTDDPADVAAAARTVVDIEKARGVDAGMAREVPGLPIGPATLVRFDDRNGILVAQPAGSPTEVLLLEAGAASPDLLVDLAVGGRRSPGPG